MSVWIRMVAAVGVALLAGCGAKDAEPPSKPAVETWRYSRELDQMSGKPRYLACLRSDNKVPLSPPYRPVVGVLCVIDDPRSDVELTISLDGDGQIICAADRSCQIGARFDDGNYHQFTSTPPSDGSANAVEFHRSVDATMMKVYLSKASKTRIEMEFHRSGRQVLLFNTQGFDFTKTGWNGED